MEKHYTKHYHKRLKVIAVIISLLIFVLMLLVVYTSKEIDKTNQQNAVLTNKINNLNETNDTLKDEISYKTSYTYLQKKAKEYQMKLANRVNIN